MTNYEFYKDEIIESFLNASSCVFRTKYILKRKCGCTCSECNAKAKEWLNSEYKESIKLSKTEYHILKGLDNKWKYIVRNAFNYGIEIHTFKPCKDEDTGVWDSYDDMFDIPYSHLFKFIKWEDEEPYLIEDLLKCEVVD